MTLSHSETLDHNEWNKKSLHPNQTPLVMYLRTDTQHANNNTDILLLVSFQLWCWCYLSAFNSLRSCEAHAWPALIQEMACRLIGATPLRANDCQLEPWVQFWIYIYIYMSHNAIMFTQEMENVVCKLTAIYLHLNMITHLYDLQMPGSGGQAACYPRRPLGVKIASI